MIQIDENYPKDCEVGDTEFLLWLRNKLNRLMIPIEGRVLLIKAPQHSNVPLEPLYGFIRIYAGINEDFLVLLNPLIPKWSKL